MQSQKRIRNECRPADCRRYTIYPVLPGFPPHPVWSDTLIAPVIASGNDAAGTMARGIRGCLPNGLAKAKKGYKLMKSFRMGYKKEFPPCDTEWEENHSVCSASFLTNSAGEYTGIDADLK